MNSEVRKFIESFESKMSRSEREVKINEIESKFLDDVFGPEFSYNFNGLTAQLPFKDYKGGDRYIDFYYQSGEVKIIIEIDGYKYHVGGITAQQYDDHQERQNDLILSGGWLLVRFTANMIIKKSMVCRRQLMQAVGKSLILNQSNQVSTIADLWLKRKAEILSIAKHNGGIKVQQVAHRFSVHRNTALRWLRKMTEEGDLVPVKSNKKIREYKLPSLIA
ncbi:hypothetical protein FE782_25415 [Paenibacillus antri]|uniref:DUF559 domain-containing protein n=1 Tax=Paenibacillus antri TaxID=2582848 RepID=A0A5R9G548_9BACL|nr:hypothetical protein [Paenibacillus antri]TLS49456.1 hypothetical protein FE782_25415 [Paenibacillus antri]